MVQNPDHLPLSANHFNRTAAIGKHALTWKKETVTEKPGCKIEMSSLVHSYPLC